MENLKKLQRKIFPPNPNQLPDQLSERSSSILDSAKETFSKGTRIVQESLSPREEQKYKFIVFDEEIEKTIESNEFCKYCFEKKLLSNPKPISFISFTDSTNSSQKMKRIQGFGGGVPQLKSILSERIGNKKTYSILLPVLHPNNLEIESVFVFDMSLDIFSNNNLSNTCVRSYDLNTYGGVVVSPTLKFFGKYFLE